MFETLDFLEQHLANHRYLCGDELTEVDVRLFTTLVRFDAVYFGHFKCNRRRIVDYPNLWAYTRAIYQQGGIGDTVNLKHINGHYYESHRSINPTGIVPVGPAWPSTCPCIVSELLSRSAGVSACLKAAATRPYLRPPPQGGRSDAAHRP